MESWSLHTLNQELHTKMEGEESKHWLNYARHLRKQNLPIIFNLKHLSKITNIEQDYLYRAVYRYNENKNYQVFRIKKRSGGYRFIHSPNENLKKTQFFINKYILSKLPVHHSCFSYHKNGGILKCAQQHTNAKILFKYDLQDFFFCINEIKVYHLFKNLGYTPKLSFQIARLCTITLIKNYKKYIKKYRIKDRGDFEEKYIELGVLPQGAPTSPMLSNILAKPLDDKLARFAESEDLVYTRYADDIVFSSYKNISLKRTKEINAKIVEIIRSERFILNKKKILISKAGDRKLVLGLLVHNGQPQLTRQTKKKIDTFLYGIEKFGWIKVSKHYGFLSPLGFCHHLSGLITYAQYIDSKLGIQYRERLNQLVPELMDYE